jgi:hypothetical protein
MLADNDYMTLEWPLALQHVDIVMTRFCIDFLSPCRLQPADFLGLGNALRLAGRQLNDLRASADRQQWRAIFQPPLSSDPVARRKYQKPAPAFVVTMPITRAETFDAGDQFELEVLFIGTGIPLIQDFLRSFIHLGRLGLVAGEGRFEVSELYSKESDGAERVAWRQHEPLEAIAFTVQPLSWLLQIERIAKTVMVKFTTPTRLIVDGKPLRKPSFSQVFPFMLRRATSMLYAHGGVEVLDDSARLLQQVRDLSVVESKLYWHDWRSLAGRQDLVLGGFLGAMSLQGQALKEIYWVLAVASLFGIGKGATYGGGRFTLALQ